MTARSPLRVTPFRRPSLTRSRPPSTPGRAGARSSLDSRRATGRLDVDPLDVGLAREPGPLPLGVAHRVPLHPPERLVLREPALLDLDELTVAYRLERRQLGSVAPGQEPPDLLPEAGGNKRLGTRAQALRQRRAVQCEPDVHHVVRPACIPPAAGTVERAAAPPHRLEGPDHPHPVVRVAACRG